MTDYSTIPEHMRDGARLYIENGIPPGSFLTAVISNDLFGALGKADEINRDRIFDWCRFFYNEAPGGCYGSAKRFDDWIAKGGLAGQSAA
jgi:hypothetical protein